MKYKNTDYIKEAVIQANLYRACKDEDLSCDLQYVVFPNEKGQCVFDLIVIESYEIIAIVEIKTTKTPLNSVDNSNQIKKI